MDREINQSVHEAFAEIAKTRSWHDEGDLTKAHEKLQGAYASAMQATSELRRAALLILLDAMEREIYKLEPYTSAEQLEKQSLERQIDALTWNYYSAKVNAQNA